MKKSRIAAVLVLAMIAYFSFRIWHSPAARLKRNFDLCFIEDSPGISDAYLTYTPYKCSDPSKKIIGDRLEGNWAELSDLVLVDDATFEITVESDRFFDATCIPNTKSVVRGQILPDGQVKFEVLSLTETPGPC